MQPTWSMPRGSDAHSEADGAPTTFLRDFLELHDELVDDVERELSSETKDAPRQGA